MSLLREEPRGGEDALRAITELLQDARAADPTLGLYEAADVQWWWAQAPRLIETFPQLVWFDEVGRPQAAVIMTGWSYGVQMDPVVLPGATPELVAQVVDSGLHHASTAGFDSVQLEVDRADHVLREALCARGFEVEDSGWAEAWMSADTRPEISPLPSDYQLTCRLGTRSQPHHLTERNGDAVERRLQQTSLYRADLDLVVLDVRGNVAAYGLFWFDPVTSTGMIEPMRTEDAHRRRGLARHLLTAGIDKLADVGADRVKVCFELSNPASSELYPSIGFRAVKRTDVLSGPTKGLSTS
ncbi:MAG: GNAT family N-acetyltransferase [Desertimonas sp.]